MGEQPDTTDPSGGTAVSAVLIRLNPRFGGGRAVVCHLDAAGQETEVATLQSGGHPASDPPDISELVREEIAAGHRRIIIDLVHVPWLNSSGLGYLVSLWSTVSRGGGDPMVVNVSGRLMELFKLMKLDEVFRFAPTVDAAITP